MKTAHYMLGLLLAVGVAAISFGPTHASAQQRNPDITRQELANFDRFLDSHPQIRADLTRNPNLINDARYVREHEELREFLATHDGVREELRETPTAFMRRENRYDAYNGGGYSGGGYNGGGRPGYYRDEDQPHMEAALQHLRQAEQELGKGTSDKGGHRVRAMEMIRQAQSELNAGINFDDRHSGDRR